MDPRCPECDWQPQSTDRWRCGCGHAWNTLETRGVCPLCEVKQPEVECLECKASSPLEEWFGDEKQVEDEEDEEEEAEDRLSSPLMAPLSPSPALAVIVGAEPATRVEVTKRLWRYIKDHGLQDPVDRRMINADATLKAVVGADRVNMFELTKLVMKHLS